MGEVTGDLKRLIKLQRQRPAFARTISWEFSNTEEGPKKGKNKKKTQSKSQVCGLSIEASPKLYTSLSPRFVDYLLKHYQNFTLVWVPGLWIIS